ncbi:MAG: hypothetical protein AB7T06_06995 [Kofleriaceae bacterium]
MSHHFASWIRLGLAATRGSTAPVAANPTVPVRVSVDGVEETIEVSLHGAGDIASIAGSAIRRRDPAPYASGVSPAGIPSIELAAVDLPWRFSPAQPNEADQLLPWIALIVIAIDLPLARANPSSLPTVTLPATELPDPSTLWAWAHVQIETTEADVVSPLEIARTFPDRAVARLVCPRRLEPNRRYRACLVPVFEMGRLAGLGKPTANVAPLTPAWSPTMVTTNVELPVYDTWEFSTGVVADFETIARRLRGRDPDDLLPPLAVDVRSVVGADARATTFGLLKPTTGQTSFAEAAAGAATLATLVATETEAMIGPPLYGSVQTGRALGPGDSDWLSELNLDPRRRVQAEAGAAVVRADQEELVADARAAVGRIGHANTLIRGAQLASALSTRILSRHIATRPATRIVATMWRSLEGEPTGSVNVDEELISPAMRRLVRPRGPIARGRASGLAWARVGRDLDTRIPAPKPREMATVGKARILSGTHPVTPMRPQLDALFATTVARSLAIRNERLPASVVEAAPTAIAVVELAANVLTAASPARIRARTAERIGGIAVAPTFDEVAPGIELSRPIADRVATLRPDMFLPGVTTIPPDTATVLSVDPAAVAAVMAGANHELARELAWRGIPIDSSTTLLRQLWDRQSRTSIRAHDITAIDQWQGVLGAGTLGSPTVFLVRSEIVRRFPDAIYACVRAVPDPDVGRAPGTEYILPVFRGLAGPDILYVGFTQSLADLRTQLGAYLVIQQRPGHTRFGLDADPLPGANTWVNLSWKHIPEPVTYLSLKNPPTGFPSNPAWGSSAGSMAAILERPAVRVSIHLDELDL